MIEVWGKKKQLFSSDLTRYSVGRGWVIIQRHSEPCMQKCSWFDEWTGGFTHCAYTVSENPLKGLQHGKKNMEANGENMKKKKKTLVPQVTDLTLFFLINQIRNREELPSCSVTFNPIWDLLTTMSSWATKAGVPGQLEAECCVQVCLGCKLKGRVFPPGSQLKFKTHRPLTTSPNYSEFGQPLQHKLINLS